MQFFNFILALSPIIFVLLGIMLLKRPAKQVAPVALIWTIFLAFTYFNVNGLAFKENVAVIDAHLWKGVKEGLKIVAMVFGAFVILNVLKETKAMDDVKTTVAKISGVDRRVQLIVVGLMFPIFLEGAAGAGAPAAIAAPFLVALGFDPITSIAIALLGDATPPSWGGAGLTTITGGQFLVDEGLSTAALNSAMVGRIHMFGVMIIPFLMVLIAFGKKGFKGIVPYLFYSGITTGLTMFLLSNFVGPEFTSMGTGIISMILTVIFVKMVRIKTPDEFKYKIDHAKQHFSSFRALSPYIYMMILLPAVRYGVPYFIEDGFALICTFGYIVWVDTVIFICAVLGAITLGVKFSQFSDICKRTIMSIFPVLITMGSLLVVSYIMQSGTTGMMSLIANDIASLAGGLYPAAAVFIGAIGSFITGTGLGSNIMFAGLHTEAALTLGMNPITVFAGQNSGAALGNLICPNNTVAACATVGEVGNENKVMKITLKSFGIILLLYMALSLLYTLVLFPNFGQ